VDREEEHIERRLRHIEKMLHLLARVVMKDQNDLNALLKELAPEKALSSTIVTTTKL